MACAVPRYANRAPAQGCGRRELPVGAEGGPGSLQPRCSSGTEIASLRAGSQGVGGCLPDVFQAVCCSDTFSAFSRICLPAQEGGVVPGLESLLAGRGVGGTGSRSEQQGARVPARRQAPRHNTSSRPLCHAASAKSTLRAKSFCPMRQLCWLSAVLGFVRRIQALFNHFGDKYVALACFPAHWEAPLPACVLVIELCTWHDKIHRGD